MNLAHEISNAGIPEDHNLPYRDVDWFKFTGMADNLYLIKATGTIYPQLNLYSTNQTTWIDGDTASSTVDSALIPGSAG